VRFLKKACGAAWQSERTETWRNDNASHLDTSFEAFHGLLRPRSEFIGDIQLHKPKGYSLIILPHMLLSFISSLNPINRSLRACRVIPSLPEHTTSVKVSSDTALT
jgi:hypothetical protein